jgi:hypothetical protein
MTNGKRNRRALQDMVRLHSKLEEVALGEEVREEFDVLDKQGVPLPKQPARATPAEIDARTIEQFKKMVPTELLVNLVDDEPPPTGSRTARALGRVAAIVDKTQEHSHRTRKGLAVQRKEAETAYQRLHRELIAALAKIELRAGSKNKSKVADAYLKANHPRAWRDVWLRISSSRRREIMIESQRVRANNLAPEG